MSLTTLVLLCSLTLSSPVLAQSKTAPEPRDATTDSSWYSQALQSIRDEEYAFHEPSDEPGVWSAPNRLHELRSRVSTQGLEVFPRATSADGVGAEWKLMLSTASFGRYGDAHELGHPTISTSASRVELDHGSLVEWFVNDERGIEQGWTIAARPRGVDPLWIGLVFGGDLSLRIDASGRSGVLVDACGEVKLHYRNLVVIDAAGRELDARIAPSPSGVGIEIDDANARYPVLVDPVLTGPAWTVESNQASADLGWSVACAGDVNGDGYSDVIVGADGYDNGQSAEGRAYVYLGSGGSLAASAAWTAESNQASAQFGVSVATAGDVNGDGYGDVIVGADAYDNGQSGEGRAYVYLGSGSGLAASAAWTAESDQAFASFGWSVSTAGDVNGDGYSDVIVGAIGHDNGQTGEGRAYVYLGSGSGLAVSAAWTAESDQALAHFGWSVSTAGDVNGDGRDDVVIGAYSFGNGETGEGRAYVYHGTASGLSTSVAWTAESNQLDAHFGMSVATAGDVNSDGFADVIVGADGYDNGEVGEGRAFVYLGSAAGLSAGAAWSAESNLAGAGFGRSVSTAGDVNGDGYSDVIVGVHLYDNGQSDEGRAYVYLGSGSGLAASAAWTAESNQTDAVFGTSVSTAGDVNGDGYSDVIVGAPFYTNGESFEGRAFVYLGSATGLASSSAWTAESNQASTSLGVCTASAGDVNGDGYSDVIVGAYRYDNGQTDEGRVFAYMGSSAGLAMSAAWTAESDQASAFFGYSAASAGDVNGDGYSDVIVGATQFDGDLTDEGRAFVYLGSAIGLSASAAWSAESNQAAPDFGLTVGTAGDVNGDGYSDVIVGAPRFDNGQLTEGRAFVYLGSSNGLAASAAWTAESDQLDAHFGESVSSAGDVNGDGFSDVLVGASQYDNGQADKGRAFVYLGSAAGLATNAVWTAESNQGSALFGESVSTAGDVNGDGFSDLIVGAYLYDNGEVSEGRAYVYLGWASGVSSNAAWTAEGNLDVAQFGSSVSAAGDVNGDGYGDVIVGAPGFDNIQDNEGRAFLYLGSATGLATSAAWTAESNQASATFGFSVSTAGDVNGDGYSDVIVGATGYDGGQTDEGRAYVYYGNEGRGGWTLAPQQRRRNNSAPIALLGRSHDSDELRLRLRFERRLAGFAWASGLAPKARLQWEIAPLRAALDGSRIESGPQFTLTGSPIVFDQLVEFVPPGPFFPLNRIVQHVAAGAYHWRARLRTNNPVFPVTPWVTMGWNNVTETKLRVGPLPASHVSH